MSMRNAPRLESKRPPSEPCAWRAKDGGQHQGLFVRDPDVKARTGRIRDHQVAEAQRQKAKAVAEAAAWIETVKARRGAAVHSEQSRARGLEAGKVPAGPSPAPIAASFPRSDLIAGRKTTRQPNSYFKASE